MGEHDDADDDVRAGGTESPLPGGESGLLGGTALGALPGAQPPQDGGVARSLGPGDSPLLAPLFGAPSDPQYFSIDLDRAPQAIADLRAAAEYLSDRAEAARRLANVPAPGVDGVSQHAVEELGRWAVHNGADALVTTLDAGAEQLTSFATKLQDDLKSYFHVDHLELPPASAGLTT